MNNARRKILKDAEKQLKDICNKIENVKDDEQCAYDSLPESLQMSDKAEQMIENIERLEDLVCNLEDYIGEYSSEIEYI